MNLVLHYGPHVLIQYVVCRNLSIIYTRAVLRIGCGRQTGKCPIECYTFEGCKIVQFSFTRDITCLVIISIKRTNNFFSEWFFYCLGLICLFFRFLDSNR